MIFPLHQGIILLHCWQKWAMSGCRIWLTRRVLWIEHEYWQQQHGRSDKWIQQRMMRQETRNKLTDYWKDHDIKGTRKYAFSFFFFSVELGI
jgi:hypothetical protein